MKILKMRIKRENLPNKTHYEYPTTYDPKKVVFGPIYEIDGGKKKLNYEYIIFGVKDLDAEIFKKSHNKIEKDHKFECEEITKEEAIIHGNENCPQIEKILDSSKVLSICAKVARGEQLTDKDRDVLDPDKPELGINRSKSFSEYLNEALDKF